MKQETDKKSQQKEQQHRLRSNKEKEQDIKNAAYIASIDQPNLPNT
jgi:hypothetical protein